MDLINTFVDLWPVLLSMLVPIILYAETHYSFKGVYSSVKKPEPEMIVDAPHRIEPGLPIPILLLLKDTHLYPASIEQVEATMLKNGHVVSTELWDLQTETFQQKYAFRILKFDPPANILGAVQLDVAVSLRCGDETNVYHNDNYNITSHKPLDIFISEYRLPQTENWYFGDMHTHTSYTEDQVEFGAPLDATVELCRAMGLSFFAATDHSYDLDDEIDNYLKNDPKLEKWQIFRKEVAEQNASNNDFAVLPGEEVSAGNARGRNVHFLILNHPDFIAGKGDSAEKWFRTRPDFTISEILTRLSDKAVAIAAHPEVRTRFLQWLLIRRGKWDWLDYQNDRLNGMQIWNGVSDRSLQQGIKRWVQLLLAGKRRFIVGGTDAHGNFNRFRQISFPFWTMREDHHQLFGTVRTAVYVDGPPTQEHILAAIKQGRCMITDGPFVEWLLEDNHGNSYRPGDTTPAGPLTLKLTALSSPEYGAIKRITLYCGDLEKQSETAMHLRYQDKQLYEITLAQSWLTSVSHGYLRVALRTYQHHDCFTNPIWLGHGA